MNYSLHYSGPTVLARAASIFAALALLASASAALGQNVVRVEEDWSLEIGEPDTNSVGPQVLATMSPNSNLLATYFTAEFNHRSAPTWSPGGISIHRWTGETRNASFDRADRTVMQTSSEIVTWTQSLHHYNGRLYYTVFNGASSTWGPFGYSNMLRLDTSWGSNNINGYTPVVSVANSGAAYAGNRIKMLKITQIRMTLSDGTVLTDNTERIVQQLVE
jgi:hypothetical protein